MNAELDALAANGSPILVRCPSGDDCSNPAARVTMQADWQDRCRSDDVTGVLTWEGEPIPIIGCGAPWHYVEDIPQCRSKGSTDDVAMRVRDERIRQVQVEGYDREGDAEPQRLARAAAAYLLHAEGNTGLARQVWPWGPAYYKPKDFVRDIERACALAIAAIEGFEARPRSPLAPMPDPAEQAMAARRQERALIVEKVAERLWTRIYRRPTDPPWEALEPGWQQAYRDMVLQWLTM